VKKCRSCPHSFPFGEVAHKSGLRPSALRYYERVRVLPAPKRAGGQRRYDTSIFKHVRLIQAAQKAGFSIEDIKTLQNESKTGNPYSERLQALARRKLVEVEKLIADAQAMKQTLEVELACQCAMIEDCLPFLKEEE
jgi:MerR family transcriptional regulator, redox-sensitive transcriptional activator SoxR